MRGEAALKLSVHVVLTDLRALRSLAQFSSPVQSKASLSSVSEAYLLLFCIANTGWVQFFEVNPSQICSSRVSLGGGGLLDPCTIVYISVCFLLPDISMLVGKKQTLNNFCVVFLLPSPSQVKDKIYCLF